MLLLALLACKAAPEDSAPAPVDLRALPLTAAGPYAVGHRVIEVAYSPPDGGERVIPVDLWYPSEDTEGRGTDYDGLVEDELAWRDAALAPPTDAGGYPVHVYSHGNQGFGGTSAFLSRALASHGHLVVAPGHVGNRLQDYIDPKPTSIYIHRASDVSAALDALVAEVPEARVDEVVLSGHSFGNYSCWAAGGATLDLPAIEAMCAAGEAPSGTCTPEELAAFAAGLADPRVVATLHMAGTMDRRWFGAEGHLGMAGPVMFMGGTNDPVGQEAQWEAVEGIDYTWVELDGACHQSFALGTCSTLDAERAFRVISAYALAFSRAELLGDAGGEVQGLLQGELNIDEIVSFQRRGP